MTDANHSAYNTNPANNNNFLITISGGGKSVDYWARAVTLPGFMMTGADMNYQNKQFSLPSNTRQKDELTIDFIVEERLTNVKFIRNWMRKGLYGDGPIQDCLLDLTVFFLDSNKTPVDQIIYKGAFPTNMGQLSLESGIIDAIPMTISVGFQYMEEVFGEGGGDPWGMGRE